MCRVNARLSACVKIVKSGSCEGRRRRPEHKIYRVLHSYYRHHLSQIVTLHSNKSHSQIMAANVADVCTFSSHSFVPQRS